MAKYRIYVEVSLRTYTTPDGFFTLESDDVEDFEDTSYFRDMDASAEGGEMNFVIEAESEDAARRKGEDLFNYIAFAGDSMEWEFESMTITDIDLIEVPMTKEYAITMLQNFMSQDAARMNVSPDLVRAIQFLLAFVTRPTRETTEVAS
jgi:hypothetical protein